MLRSKVVRDPEALDKTLIDLQDQGCSIVEVQRSMDPHLFILFDDPWVHARVPDEDTKEPDDEDLTNEEKFLKDWGRRPVHANVIGSVAYEYLCPTNFGIPVDQKEYNIESGICRADESACHNCAEKFWKSKYKRPEKKEV